MLRFAKQETCRDAHEPHGMRHRAHTGRDRGLAARLRSGSCCRVVDSFRRAQRERRSALVTKAVPARPELRRGPLVATTFATLLTVDDVDAPCMP